MIKKGYTFANSSHHGPHAETWNFQNLLCNLKPMSMGVGDIESTIPLQSSAPIARAWAGHKVLLKPQRELLSPPSALAVNIFAG